MKSSRASGSSQRRPALLRRGLRAARFLGLAGAVAWAGGCGDEFDTTTPSGPTATLGDDLYGLFCDRLGADVLQEDMTGASYHALCHYDADGVYADEVDTTYLPPTSGEASAEARRIALAKMHALARRRGDLVRAFNATFPDIEIDDPSTEDPTDTVNLQTAMMAFSQRLAALYESNPYDPSLEPEPLAPKTTRSLGDVFEAVGVSLDAKAMLTRMWARRGYRPSNVGLGAMRSTLAYPDLRDFTTSAVGLLGPLGPANPELRQLLAVLKQKMATMTPETSGLPPLGYSGPAQPNRPRTTIEALREIMLTEDERFAPYADVPPRYIAVRDRRGYAVPTTLTSTFFDGDGDGLADVDGFGRFIDASGAAVQIDTPFSIPGQPTFGSFDEFGRATSEPYVYVDTSRTPAASLSTVLTPLLDATEYADPADPNAFMSEYETLMYALAGMNVLFGPREEAEYDFEADQVVPVGTGCATCMRYSRFRGEDSPLVDLVYATGQIIGDKDSDVLLLGLIDLAENHEPELARLIAAALRVKEISDDHDALAGQGQVLPAGLAYENPIWDEAAQPLSRIASEPRLLTNLLGALADPVVVSSIGGSGHMGETLSLFASTLDEMTYDPTDINGPALNLTDGGFSVADPNNLVDTNAPRNGKNRSILERTVQLIYDASGARACNKDGAVVNANVLGISLEWPLFGDPYGQCALFEINDLAAFYFGAVLDPAHPKKAQFTLKDGALNDLMDALGFISSPDEMFEASSGLTGMTTHPSYQALNRLVYFGASSDVYPNMPDHDSLNQGSRTDEFIFGLMEPVGTSVCPNVLCATQSDTLRIRTRNSMFAWERGGFLEYMRPVITAFANVACSEDVSICDLGDIRGERMFLDLAEVFWRHYPGPDHGDYCSESLSKSDRKYCSGAGLNRYEPIIDKAMRTDLIPALHEFAVAVHDVSQVTIERGPLAGQTLSGAQILEITTKILLSQDYSAQTGLKDRHGIKTAQWTDGTVQSQVTPFNIMTDALHQMDTAFDAVEDGELRKAQWKRARSQIVDVLLATEGSGPNTRFKIHGIMPLLGTVLRLAREQVNAHCPDREAGSGCNWAKVELANNLSEALSSPFTAAVVDLTEKVRQDPKARRALERYLTHILEDVGSGEELQGTLASMVDAMQVLADDEKLVPIMKAASIALEPEKGAADTTLQVLQALTSDSYDPYHVMDKVLANLVTPMTGPEGQPELSPMEVFMDVIAEVHRADPTDPYAPLDPSDYGYIMDVMREFMLSQSRGLEQIYAIVRKRKRQ